MTSHVEQQVQARIAAAARREEDMRRRRAELAAARRRGLAARHARKLRGAEDHAGMGQQPTTVGQTPTVARPATQTQPSRVDTATTERDSVSLATVAQRAEVADPDRGDTPTTDRQPVGLTVPVVTETVTTELDRVDTNTVAADSLSAADEGQP